MDGCATHDSQGRLCYLSMDDRQRISEIDPGRRDAGGGELLRLGGDWRPSERPRTWSITPGSEPPRVESPLSATLGEATAIEVRDTCVAVARPRAVSVPIGRSPRPRTRSFTFAAAPDESAPVAPAVAAPASGLALPSSRPGVTTRVKPPKDVIKLEDRLRYLLQPSLEVLMAERSLEYPVPPFPYQWEGIAFLYPRQTAILADEMGLGKTMQAIMAIRLLLHRNEIRRVLMVCPKPLVTNWQREFAVWAPEIPVQVIEGSQQRRDWQWHLPDAPVKMANYELLHRDAPWFDEGHPAMEFDLVVLDETQRIKNRHSATSEAARAIHSRRHWALTGTPVENSPEDLVGIFEFLAPGLLHSEMRPSRMGRAVGDYVLRRTKDQVNVDLPPKLFRDAELELTAQQAEAYRMAEDDGVVRLGALGNEVTIQHVFELVLRLKQICNFDPSTGASAKHERLEADLEEVAASGRKAIVFSQWVETIEQLRERLERFGPLEYHGRIPPRRRDEIVRRFRDDPARHVLLMSYGAGAVGLNLQFASYVFLYDRWWNPAVEDQAINRVHRIGSAGPVTVTRFLMLGTIEERINRILEEKRELFDTIFSGAEAHGRLGLTQEELFGLFDLRVSAVSARAAA
jgi:SNF2 family DNA or RNA helicase